MQSSLLLVNDPELDDMGHKELSALIGKLTGRVTALEKKPNPAAKKWGVDLWIGLGILVATIVGLPIILAALIEPHLKADLKADVKNEVADQLKDPLKQIGEIAGDVREIKGKLEVLDPLIQKFTGERLSDAGKLDSKQLLARLPELKTLATIAKKESITVKPEVVETVGTKLVKAGNMDAWNTALDFVNYKSFLNFSLSIQVRTVVGDGTLTTVYNWNTPNGMARAKFSIAGAVPQGNAAHFRSIGKPDPNESSALGNDWIIVDGGGLVIDGMDMRKVIFRNVYILYDGAPLQMQDVYFINCTFQIKQQSNGERLALAVLRPAPATTLDNSSQSAMLIPLSTHY
jgi:hypothetical protein